MKIPHPSLWEWYEVAGLSAFGALLISLLGFGLFIYFRSGSEEEENKDTIEQIEESDATEISSENDGDVVTMEPAITRKQSAWKRIWTLWKHDKNRQKIGEDGYVRWYRIDDTISEPQYIKPRRTGGGEWEYEHNGETYLFPREAMKPDAKTGMWTVIHHVDDALPININEPGKPAMAPDEIKEYLTQSVASSPPSWFSQFDLDASDAMKFVIVGFIGLMLAQGFMGGIF
jgi:hypothetical protein